MQSLRSELMVPFAKAMEPPLPAWLKQKPRDPEDVLKDKVEEQELRSVLRQEWQEFLVETKQAEETRNLHASLTSEPKL